MDRINSLLATSIGAGLSGPAKLNWGAVIVVAVLAVALMVIICVLINSIQRFVSRRRGARVAVKIAPTAQQVAEVTPAGDASAAEPGASQQPEEVRNEPEQYSADDRGARHR